jgi:hypothetical protein
LISVQLETFIPWTLIKRGYKKEVITPIDAPEAFTVEAAAERQRKKAEQHTPLVRALGLAYYWQRLLDEGKFATITQIAEAEGMSKGHVSRLMQLLRLSPETVQSVMQPTYAIRLEQFTRQDFPLCWEKQRAAMAKHQ